MTLQRFDNQGIEIVVDTQTGESFASQRALARMCNVSDTTIMRWKGAAQIETKNAETLTPGGVQSAVLYNEDAILSALTKYNPESLVRLTTKGYTPVDCVGLLGYY